MKGGEEQEEEEKQEEERRRRRRRRRMRRKDWRSMIHLTLKASLDNVKGMDNESGDGAGCEAS